MQTLGVAWLALSAALCLGGAGGGAEQIEGAPIRVVTFNVRYGTADDGENHWDVRRENVLRTLRAHGADLIGLQEALPFQVDFLSAGLPAHDVYAVSREGADGETCAILWRRDRFEVLERATFWLAPEPEKVGTRGWDAALPRVCSRVRLRDTHSERDFTFANTHFDHRGSAARLESARLLARRLNDERVVLAGDFNAPEGSAPILALTQAGFSDTFRSVHPDEVDVGTFTGFADLPRAGKIDHVFVRGGARVLAARIDRRRFAGRWPSDHLPVTAEIDWLAD